MKAKRSIDLTYLGSLFLLFLVFASGVTILGRFLLESDKVVESSNIWISRSYAIIDEEEKIPTALEMILSNQRAYLLTGEKAFFQRHTEAKKHFVKTLDKIEELTAADPAQAERIKSIRKIFHIFSTRLETRASKYAGQLFHSKKDLAATFEAVRTQKDQIVRLNREAMEDERTTLQLRIQSLEKLKHGYYRILFTGGGGMAFLMFVLNAVILHSRSQRASVEESLKESEERFTLAIEGTNDGIFDWNVLRNTVFYSRQFYAMLGIDREASIGTIEEFRAHIHPEDAARAWQLLESYMRRETAEFSATFRMLHTDPARTVWVQSRAKGVFGRTGKPLRIVGANSDVTLHKEYQTFLKEQKQSAEKANRAKSDFLAHMSHEIRTPLTAISGIAEILQRRQDNFDDREKQLVRTLSSSTSTLKDLICDILDFSRIESGELTLSESDFPLAEVFEDIISLMSIGAREKGLDFTFDYSAVPGLVFRGDSLRLRQVLINLIGNAIKFTDKGAVHVTADKAEGPGGDALTLTISDTGIGIDKKDFDLVFERFKQADSSASRRHQGSGLGLPISRRLVQLMGGTLTLDSTQGKGSTFRIILPLRQTQGNTAADTDLTALNKKLGDKIKADLQGGNRILIVDDYEGNVIVVSYILDEIGYAHDIARTGEDAIAKWKESHYDMILMDVQMPGMDGFTATATIRAIEKEKGLAPTPIVGMTAHALVGDKDLCIKAGMDVYLSKPIVESDLKACILDLLRKKRSAA